VIIPPVPPRNLSSQEDSVPPRKLSSQEDSVPPRKLSSQEDSVPPSSQENSVPLSSQGDSVPPRKLGFQNSNGDSEVFTENRNNNERRPRPVSHHSKKKHYNIVKCLATKVLNNS